MTIEWTEELPEVWMTTVADLEIGQRARGLKCSFAERWCVGEVLGEFLGIDPEEVEALLMDYRERMQERYPMEQTITVKRKGNW